MTLTDSPENREFLSAIKQWSDSIPTMYFLDICCISNIKNKDIYFNEPEKYKNKCDFLERLSAVDLPHNAISCLPALIEKVSDLFNDKSTHELKEEVERDLDALNNFFKKARVVEEKKFTEMYVNGMKNEYPESSGSDYHKFLECVNSMKLGNTISSANRLSVAKEIIRKATELNVDKFSAVVITAIACVYGCIPAKKVMKFKDEPAKFNSSNALADIQIISRIGRLADEIESNYRLGKTKYARTTFLTDDDNLKKLYDYFFVKDVTKSETEFGISHNIKLTIEGHLLFPDLFNYKDDEDQQKKQKEYIELLDFMGVRI
ncbi:hypothetical protein [Kosakonia sacchari]|uniref:hypothetical protein n=1 Tax=Kosakonia sacchari TaxID=1158459 RepID=UPI0011413B07|nr:hypothetical protein [Kosakonia sacchari]